MKSSKYLNFLSFHPLPRKKDEHDRQSFFTITRYHVKSLNFIINTFLLNDYSLDFIFNRINLKLKTLFNKRTNTPTNNMNKNNIK